MNWHINSWKDYVAKQQPVFKDLEKLQIVENELKNKPPIANLHRILELKNKLANIDENTIIFQAGDCAEPILNEPHNYLNEFQTLFNECEELLSKKFNNVIKIARIGGQFAKPRSSEVESKDGEVLEIYRGDVINNFEFNLEGRIPDPGKMIKGYNYSKIIYENSKDLYCSHEALLLPYEANLIREQDGIFYSSAADFLWIGNRTRFINSAQVELLKGIINPIGVKIDHNYNFEEIDNLNLNLNPKNEPGRLTFICRMGVNNIKEKLNPLLSYCKIKQYNINWMVDPMHGNTYLDKRGIKRRNLEDVIFEALYFIKELKANKLLISGLHLEISYENVKECLEKNFLDDTVYLSRCDPRLNKEQLFKFLNASLIEN